LLGPFAAASASAIHFAISALIASRLKLASLHRRKFQEGLDFLAHHLLDEHEAPELELEPIEILRRFSRLLGLP
jgi:hypothetical protein